MMQFQSGVDEPKAKIMCKSSNYLITCSASKAPLNINDWALTRLLSRNNRIDIILTRICFSSKFFICAPYTECTANCDGGLSWSRLCWIQSETITFPSLPCHLSNFLDESDCLQSKSEFWIRNTSLMLTGAPVNWVWTTYTSNSV